LWKDSFESYDKLEEFFSLIFGMKNDCNLFLMRFRETDESPFFKVEIELKISDSVETKRLTDFQRV